MARRLNNFIIMGLIILHWNAHSLISNGQELKQYVSTCSHPPQVICIQETWLIPEIDFRIPGYTSIRQDRPGNDRHGGCAFFIHSTISYREISIQSNMECGAVEIYLTNSAISLINVYHCKQSFKIQDFLNILNKLTSPVVLCGDFNAHNPLWGSSHLDSKGRVIDNLLEKTDLVLLNDGNGTRINPNGSLSPLDLSFVSYELATKCSWRIHQDNFGSDHFPIVISFFESPAPVDTSNISRWNFKKADWVHYSSVCLMSINSHIVDDDVDRFNSTLIKLIVDAGNLSIPKTKPNSKRGMPWWNTECTAEKKYANRLIIRLNVQVIRMIIFNIKNSVQLSNASRKMLSVPIGGTIAQLLQMITVSRRYGVQ